MSIKQRIIDYSKQIEIESIGFCKAEPDLFRLSKYQNRKDRGFTCEFEDIEALELKVKPEYWLTGAKTFIAILQSYTLDSTKNKQKNAFVKISKASITEDYHKTVQSKLEQLSEFLKANFACQSVSFCDSQAFSDRHIAKKAGLGVIGKNSFLINKTFGTSTYIGYLLTDLEIETYDQPIEEEYCGTCTKCIDACPVDAISNPHEIIANRCISYLTQAKCLTEDEKQKIKDQLYGCDICQLACPYNKLINNRKSPRIIEEYFDIKALLGMNNKTFEETIKKTSAGWRGKKHLQRNAIIALGNQPSTESVQLLNEFYNDIRDDIRKEIVHSLGRIGTKEAKIVLEKCFSKEKDEHIKQLIQKYLR